MTTSDAFFYGTLMHPKILKHIIRNDGSHLQFCPAVLLDFTRHKVKGQTYPGIILVSLAEPFVNRELTSLEKLVRGTLVSGLSEEDMNRLDHFEGDVSSKIVECAHHRSLASVSPQEYDLIDVQVHPLADIGPLSAQPGKDDALIGLHAAPLPSPENLAPAVQVKTYVFKFVDRLQVELWDFDDFVKNSASRWFDYESDSE
ncbi:hypothetical protein BKA70DRAFT_1371768 [Coprinopsis sp. MPI-PUGE-AT-0042]|nr:hypothetical protein BKA70DRAFT_1371768 [Coprinopsis sp. MPI-PUGE-AT-0042]